MPRPRRGPPPLLGRLRLYDPRPDQRVPRFFLAYGQAPGCSIHAAGSVQSKSVSLGRGVNPKGQEGFGARFIIWGDQWLRSSTSSRPFEV